MLDADVIRVDRERVWCQDGREVSYDEVIWCTHSGAADWLKNTGLDLDKGGFIAVDDCLQSVNTPGVFACGDCSHMVNHPRPKAGVYAVRQGPPIHDNVLRALKGRPLKPFKPQTQALGLISTGDRYAVASRGPFALEGRFLWPWKDRLDRDFMVKYSELPQMTQKQTTAGTVVTEPSSKDVVEKSKMRCSGCGSKVGPDLLKRVLQSLQKQADGDTGMTITMDDAAELELPQEPGAKLVQTVDYFRSFTSDPFLFGEISANHALSDVHAMGAEAVSAQAIIQVPYASQIVMEGILQQVLAGALVALKKEGCKLIGGHTCEGSDLALGFCVNGIVKGNVLRKGGLQEGDALVLTKALGSGLLLAGEMRGQAKGYWVGDALKDMQVSNRPAAKVFQDHAAHACTDVTGFGCAGHLLEMLAASPAGLKAVLNLDALPLREGFQELSSKGIASSLLPANQRSAEAHIRRENAAASAAHPSYASLFDPQTAGGLLGSVPADQVQGCVAALQAAGCKEAAVIGHVRRLREDEAAILECASAEKSDGFSDEKSTPVPSYIRALP
ncbi:unnamed protein product [Chrysoparadoxa australica]